MEIIGRSEELKTLSSLMVSEKSEFLAIYGRRRIGKTYLINQFFKENPYYLEFTGTNLSSPKQQIQNFKHKLESIFQFKVKEPIPNWSLAFLQLEKKISKLSTKHKKIIFFDELPWFASKKSGFMPALDYFWNSFLSKRNDIILIVCGSAASWMIKNIVNNKGGLHNRLTKQIHLKPFTLSETQKYLHYNKIDLTNSQILEIFMATGGVPHYLNYVKKGQSSVQFINEQFFHPNGELRLEFTRLFQSLFDNYELHMKIVNFLSTHPFGKTQSDILAKLNLKSGGTFSKTLDELEKSGFIIFTPQLNQKKKDGVYRIFDEYCLFYLQWVSPLKSHIIDKLFWQKQFGKPKYNSWAGFAFECICLKHSSQIIKALGISGLTVQSYSFHNQKTQIDLILDRSDRTMNLCEIKYYNSVYKMPSDEASKISNRKNILTDNIKKNRQIFVTLITPEKSEKNKYYLGTVDNEINLQDLFSE